MEFHHQDVHNLQIQDQNTNLLNQTKHSQNLQNKIRTRIYQIKPNIPTTCKTRSEHEFIKSNQTFPQPTKQDQNTNLSNRTKHFHNLQNKIRTQIYQIEPNIPTTCKTRSEHEFIKSNEWVANLTRIYTRSEHSKLRKNKDQIKNN